MPFGIKNYVVTFADALSLIERLVRVLDAFTTAGALLNLDHDPNTGVVIKLRPDDRKRFDQRVEESQATLSSSSGAVKLSTK